MEIDDVYNFYVFSLQKLESRLISELARHERAICSINEQRKSIELKLADVEKFKILLDTSKTDAQNV